ncbi:putative fibrosin-1 isoform 2-T2 [Discoglossus pictus]
MEAPSARPGRQLPCRRSKAQRDRKRGPSPANSSSSISPSPMPRPLRKKKRRRGVENIWMREDDVIDGFCIGSYGSLEAMQRDTSVFSAQSEEVHAKRPRGKRKRSHEASSEDPDISGPDNRLSTLADGRDRSTHKKQKKSYLGNDAHIRRSESVQNASVVSSDDLAVSFTISGTLAVPGGRLKLSVLSQVSGLERSCEKSQEPEMELPLIVPLQPQQHTSPAPPRTPCTPCPPSPAVPSTSPKAQSIPAHAPSPRVPEPVVSSIRSSLPKTMSVPQMSQRPPTPSRSLSGHSGVQNFSSSLRPPSHQQLGLFPPSPGLPPPPPLLQVTGHPTSTVTAVLSEHNVISQDVGPRFVSVPGPGAQLSSSVRPMLQFHQHNHQHTHQHTHQHFTPFPPGVGPGTFEKYPGKMESLYRQNFFSPFSPVLSALPPVLPPSVSFGSVQGAFQPKSTSTELASRCSVPPGLQHKAPQLPEQFRQRKSGRWCAMHVRVAYMILRHQERLKLARGTLHKPDFRSDLLPCLPAGLGSLPSPQELARPPSLLSGNGMGVRERETPHWRMKPFVDIFSSSSIQSHSLPLPYLSPGPSLPAGVMSHSNGHFQISPAGASFIPSSGPVGTLMRTSGFSPLAALTNGAFGGLGSPPYSNPSPIFNNKDHSTVPTFPNPHDPWNRLHRTPPSFPTAPPQVTKGGDLDKHSTPHLKEEKDRDLLLYGRLQARTSPLPPPKRLPGVEDHGIGSYMGVRPGSSSEVKHRLTPEQSSKVKVKEEPEGLAFEVGRPPLPGLHLPQPSTHFDRQRAYFLGERFPHSLEAWRDMYRRADPPPLRLPTAPPHRLYEHREERAHILREDFERARIYGLPAPSTMEPSGPSVLSALYPHPATTLLSKTPPMNMLSVPPPLISSSHQSSPPCRDLNSLYKERDAR